MQETTFPIEILLHDDASTDRTAEVVREYENKIPKAIVPIYQKENQFSRGINPFASFLFPNVRGKYIALCEGDDYWTDPLKLQKQIDFLESNEEYSACFTNATVLNEIQNTSYTYITFLKEGDVPIEEIIKMGGYIYPTASLVFRTSVLKKRTFEILIENMSGDTSLIIASGIHGKVYFFDQITTVYRRWAGGLFSRIAGNPRAIAHWKTEKINGYRKLQEMVDPKLKKIIKNKISLENLYILQNLDGIDRFQYFFALNGIEMKALLISYIRGCLTSLASIIRPFCKKT